MGMTWKRRFWAYENVLAKLVEAGNREAMRILVKGMAEMLNRDFQAGILNAEHYAEYSESLTVIF